MIITLTKAKKLNKDITQEDLDGIEVAIRELTHNNFQNRNVRVNGNVRFEGKALICQGDLIGFVVGKTVQVSNSKYNDGLYVITAVTHDTITVTTETDFITASVREAVVTLIEYPADIIAGVNKILKYDAKMGLKFGVKSETISRWTTSYFDQNSSESVNGYPAALMSFINKYRKLRWS